MMKRLRNKEILIAAAVALVSAVAIAWYEYYWLRSLYESKKESLVLNVSSAMSLAEISSDRTLSIYLDDKDVSEVQVANRVITGRRADGGESTNVISITSLSELDAGRIASVTIDKRDDVMFDAAEYDSLLTFLLGDNGIRMRHAVKVLRDSTVVSCSGMENITGLKKTETITQKKTIRKGVEYQFISAPVSQYVLAGMTGIIAVSAVVLVVLVLAFVLMIRTLRKQYELDRAKSDFTGNMTHELKTPIAVANAATDALLLYGFGDDPQKREEYLRITRGQLMKLGSMVEQILSTTKESRDSLRLEIGDVPLLPLLQEAAKDTELSAAKVCNISVSVSPENLSARMDRKLMSSVISTLLDNSVKYSGEEVRIAVSAWSRGGCIHISVADGGIGIPKECQAHVFDRFYRVPTGNVHEVKGYGIGLYFARTIVEKHSGRISVMSEPVEGSTFTISIPEDL